MNAEFLMPLLTRYNVGDNMTGITTAFRMMFLFFVLFFCFTVKSATVEIKLQQTIQRKWEDVEKANYAYGARQKYDAATGETHVWLPYGTAGEYYETKGLTISDPGKEGSGCPLATAVDGNTSGRLVYKIRFDKPIGAFRIFTGWSEWGVGNGTVGGAEYSTDGRSWTVLREIDSSGIVEPLLNPDQIKIEDLHASELYIRFFSREKADPAKEYGPNRWMKLRLAGDPAWGDRTETFFNNQIQIWVKPSTKSGAIIKSTPADVSVKTSEPPLNNTGPWAIASGAEWAGEFPRFNPMLKEAGVRWLRLFPEWHSIQPSIGTWNWEYADKMVENARKNNIQLTGFFAYFAPWASADGGTRRGPVKDIQYWRDYVRMATARYSNDIRHWEVWNEFNGSFYQGINKPEEYADLTVAAYEEIKKTNPEIQVGISVANFDVGFLDATIKAGAANHFDFVCVHPYENAGALLSGGETAFLSLADSLRRMLNANNQRENIPLWITEIGYQTSTTPNERADKTQAEVLAKIYTLAIVQGFERVFWFEARGPAYGHGTDHGLIRPDWSTRPAYTALGVLSRNLGDSPKYGGWLQINEDGYGFMFENSGKHVLVAWMPPNKTTNVKFNSEISLIDLTGKTTTVKQGESIRLTQEPVIAAGIPADLIRKAKSRINQPFPWGTDYSKEDSARCILGGINQDFGLKQINPQTTAVVNDLEKSWRRTDFSHGSEGHYVYFRADPTFVGFGQNKLEITVVAKRESADKSAGMNLTYESLSGYRGAEGWFTIPEKDGWHEHTWIIKDANFVGAWGWNFRFDSIGSPNECHIREVRIRKLEASPAK
ncbi:MAG: hypothetical protein GX804_00955 [Lentisphaerae bacterium]|nr:hypothetical protein [Lentisphaerota bacterium]